MNGYMKVTQSSINGNNYDCINPICTETCLDTTTHLLCDTW